MLPPPLSVIVRSLKADIVRLELAVAVLSPVPVIEWRAVALALAPPIVILPPLTVMSRLPPAVNVVLAFAVATAPPDRAKADAAPGATLRPPPPTVMVISAPDVTVAF